MPKSLRLYGILLLAMPCFSLASTVEITTSSYGTMQANNSLLTLLGITPPSNSAALPYTLLLTTAIDTDAVGYFQDSLEPQIAADPSRIEVTFTFGEQSFHYAGSGSTFIIAKSYGYNQSAYFDLPQAPSVRIGVEHFAQDPGEAGHPLNPPTLENAVPWENPAQAFLSAQLQSIDPNSWIGMEANATRFSITAVSAVPEPAAVTMMASGLALLLRSRGRRRRTAGASTDES